MATPGQLVKCIAEALSIPEPTVVQYDRLLAESGMRSKGGRGTSAAKVTAVDAANLLIAIMGSPVAGASIKPALEVCKTYGKLRVRFGGTSENLKTFKRLGFPTVSRLPISHSLREGLAAVIAAASVGESLIIPREGLAAAVAATAAEMGESLIMPELDVGPPLVGPENDWCVSLSLDSPTPWAQIMVDASLGEAGPGEMARLVYHNMRRDLPGSDNLHQSRTITFKTIRRIGALLAQTNEKAA